MIGALATLRTAKGEWTEGVQGSRNGIAAWVCRVRQGPGEKVKGGNTASAGRAVEAGRNGRLFGQATQDQNYCGKSVAKSGATQSQGGGWEGGSVHGG